MPSRSPRDLAAGLKKGQYDPAYYFHGAEDVLKEDAVRYILDNALDPSLRDFNFDQRSAGQLEPDAVADLCNTLPMMAERRVVLVRDVEAWKRKTKARRRCCDYLKNPSPETVVVAGAGRGRGRRGQGIGEARGERRLQAASPAPRPRSGWIAR